MKLFLAVLILMFCAMANVATSATLKWDTPTGEIVGYTASYTDGVNDYIWSFDGAMTEVPNMEVFFNLKFNVSYIFTLQAYNDAGASPVSLPTDSFTRTSYTPPVNVAPVDVLVPPGQILNPLIDI